jgi:hypothetical protein
MKKNDTLTLTLHAWWFNEIYQGRKINEYREDSDHWRKRLLDKNGKLKKFKCVKFINGYGDHRPYMLVEWLACEYFGEFDIHLGKILETGNMHIFKIPKKAPAGL